MILSYSGKRNKNKQYCNQKNNNVLSVTVGFPGGSVVKNQPANAGDKGLIPGSGRSPGEGSGNPLQYSCLGNSMERGAWQATVHGVTKELDTTWQLNNNNTDILGFFLITDNPIGSAPPVSLCCYYNGPCFWLQLKAQRGEMTSSRSHSCRWQAWPPYQQPTWMELLPCAQLLPIVQVAC